MIIVIYLYVYYFFKKPENYKILNLIKFKNLKNKNGFIK